MTAATTTSNTTSHHRKHGSSNSVSYSPFPALHNVSTTGRPSISPTRSRRRTQSASEGTYNFSRPQSANNLLAKYSAGLENTFLTETHHDTPQSQNVIAALAHFLRTQQPPPGNYMSIPYEMETHDLAERGRWSKFKKMGRRSASMPRYPVQIRLPDSAVSGTTIGGYRHIAISIPLDASPFGPGDRSQYPVIPHHPQQSQYAHAGIQPGGPIRTYMNEKGVVTVLRPVKEDSEFSSPVFSSFPPRKTTTNHDLVPRRRPRTSHAADADTTKRGNRNSAESGGQLPEKQASPQQGNLLQRSLQPIRASLAPSAGGLHQPQKSIDGVLREQGGLPNSPSGPYQQSISESVATNGEELVVADAQRATSFKSASVVDRSKQQQQQQQQQQQTPPKTVPLLAPDRPTSSRTDRSFPGTPSSSMSRKEAVRDRKRRDMEAMRTAKNKQTGASQAVEEAQHAGQQEMALAPIRTVVDVEPSEQVLDALTPPVAEARPKSAPEPMSALTLPDPITTHRLDPDAGSIDVPVTPTSRPASHRRSYDDRTSLSRRREWNASRDQERSSREAKAAARIRAKKLLAAAMSPREHNPASALADKEILRLYEAYRDHRLREMERRLRRLERNGDVWLRALVPVLDNVNRSMTAQAAPPSRNYYGSERDSCGEDSGGRRSRARRRRSIADSEKTAAELAGERMMEKLTMNVEDNDMLRQMMDGSDEDDDEDDDSGFSTIEPLMRQLASDARRRQRRNVVAAQKVGGGGDVFRL